MSPQDLLERYNQWYHNLIAYHFNDVSTKHSNQKAIGEYMISIGPSLPIAAAIMVSAEISGIYTVITRDEH